MINLYKISTLGIILLLLLAGCNNSPSQTPEEPGPVKATDVVTLTTAQTNQIGLQTATLRQEQAGQTLKLSGQIDVPPQNLVSVSIPLGGYLRSTRMLPGTQVRRGDVLAVMEDPQYIQLQQDYLDAKNKYSYAAKEYERQRELNKGKASSDKVLQQAESAYNSLRIEMKALAARLDLIGIRAGSLSENTISRSVVVRSPINGYVSKVNVNTGKYVTPSDVLFELVNPTDIHLNLTVYEKDLDKLAIGQTVTAFTNARPEVKYQTRVILVGHALNESRSAEVHCHFEKYDKSLVPGMYMNGELRLNSNSPANVLPEQAVVRFQGRDYVFVSEKDRSYRLTPVQKGPTENGLTAISANGLKGKQVVTRGAYSLLMQLKNTE